MGLVSRSFFLCTSLWASLVTFVSMKKYIIFLSLGLFLLSGVSACKAKHCAAMQDDLEGYNHRKAGKKKKGRQEGLFNTKQRR